MIPHHAPFSLRMSEAPRVAYPAAKSHPHIVTRYCALAVASASPMSFYLQVGVILIRQRQLGGVLHLLSVLVEHSLVDLDLGRRKGGGGDELQSLVADEFPGEPEEGLLEVVVGLGGDVVVLEVLLSVEGDGLGLDLALLDVDLVAGQDDGDVLADTDEIT
jgi:hypothetical protein